MNTQIRIQLDHKQWQQLGALFDEALALDPSAWPSFLEGVQAGTPQLARELSSLLSNHSRMTDFLEEPIGPRDRRSINQTISGPFTWKLFGRFCPAERVRLGRYGDGLSR